MGSWSSHSSRARDQPGGHHGGRLRQGRPAPALADFDAFLAELVLDRIARIDNQAAALCSSAGTGTVSGHHTSALMALFGSVAVAIVGLVTSRDDLRARLRQARPTGIPVLTDAAAMIAS